MIPMVEACGPGNTPVHSKLAGLFYPKQQPCGRPAADLAGTAWAGCCSLPGGGLAKAAMHVGRQQAKRQVAHLDQVAVQGFAHKAALLLVAVDEVAAPTVQRKLPGSCAPLSLLQRQPSGGSQQLRTQLLCLPMNRGPCSSCG